MQTLKTVLKLGCLLPAGIIIPGLILYAIGTNVVGPRLAAAGACMGAPDCRYAAVNGNRQVSIIGFSAEGDRFLSTGSKSGLIHSATNGRVITGLSVGRESHSYRVSSDRSRILARRRDSVKVLNWDGELLQEWQPEPDKNIQDVVDVPFVNGFLVAEPDGASLRKADGSLITPILSGDRIAYVAASANGSHIAAYEPSSDRLFVWPLERLSDGIVIAGQNLQPVIGYLQFSDDGSRLLGRGDGTTYVWQTADGARIATVEATTPRSTYAALNGAGDQLAVGFDNGTVAVFDVDSGEVINHFDHGREPRRMAFDPSGTFLAVGLDSETVVSGGELIFPPRHGDPNARGMRPGGTLRQSPNRTSSRPGFAMVWSLETASAPTAD